jgi:hypothetical protein
MASMPLWHAAIRACLPPYIISRRLLGMGTVGMGTVGMYWLSEMQVIFGNREV